MSLRRHRHSCMHLNETLLSSTTAHLNQFHLQGVALALLPLQPHGGAVCHRLDVMQLESATS